MHPIDDAQRGFVYEDRRQFRFRQQCHVFPADPAGTRRFRRPDQAERNPGRFLGGRALLTNLFGFDIGQQSDGHFFPRTDGSIVGRCNRPVVNLGATQWPTVAIRPPEKSLTQIPGKGPYKIPVRKAMTAGFSRDVPERLPTGLCGRGTEETLRKVVRKS